MASKSERGIGPLNSLSRCSAEAQLLDKTKELASAPACLGAARKEAGGREGGRLRVA